MALKASDLHIVAVISNPIRFKSRYELYRQFAAKCKDAGLTLWTCEVAFGDRPFEVTESDNRQHLQLRSWSELWHKENMANLAIQRLPADWQYVALVDADVMPVMGFDRWALETVHQLQHYMVVQMWQDAYDLGPDYQVIQAHQSYMYRYANGMPVHALAKYGQFGHPGYAWGFRREALELLGSGMSGPILDTAILGSGDHHMCLSFVGRGEASMPKNINQAYYDEIMRWQKSALKLSKDVGYVKGAINHFFHGKKKDRKYVERWDILIRNDYVPHMDLKRDWQGLWELTDRNPKLRDDIRMYFRQRNEDSIDL